MEVYLHTGIRGYGIFPEVSRQVVILLSFCYSKNIMKQKITMMDIFKNSRYRGKHVVLVAGKVYTANTGAGAADILRKVRVSQPGITPEVAYLPKAHSLILWM